MYYFWKKDILCSLIDSVTKAETCNQVQLINQGPMINKFFKHLLQKQLRKWKYILLRNGNHFGHARLFAYFRLFCHSAI